MDDRIKAKALMAGGLFILAGIGLVIVLVVLPAVQGGGGSPMAVAQPPAGGMPGMPEPGGMPGAPGMAGGMPGMPGMPGAGGAPAGGAPAGGAAAAPAVVVEPLEESRDNPFVPFGGAGLVSGRVSAGLAFAPSYHTMPIGVLEQYQFPTVGPNGQSIQVPTGLPSRSSTGPEAPPQEAWMRVAGVLYDPNGKAMVILQGRGGQNTVLKVGERYNEWRVESITKDQMVLSREEDGQTRRRIIHLQTGGGGRRPGATPGAATGATPGQPGVTMPGARTGTGATGGQPEIRRPGGARPGAFPGAGAGEQPQPE